MLFCCAPKAVAADNKNDAAAIVASMRVASGGDHWDAISSLHIVATTISGVDAIPSEHWEDVVNGRYRVRQTWPTYAAQVGFDGITSWRQGRSGIAYGLGDIDAALVAANEAFRVSRSWWFPDRRGSTISFLGLRTENGRGYDVLSITPERGRPFEAWVDHITHLLAKTDEQQAEDRAVTTYSDYRLVHGLKIPFTVRSGSGADPRFDQVERLQSVEVNAPVPDSFYSLPPLSTADVDLPRNADSVEIPFHLTKNNRILVPLTIDGVTLQAEFDTGGGLVLQPATVAKLRLATANQRKQGGGGEGFTTSTNGVLRNITLGEARIRDLPFQSFAYYPEEPDEGLIGLEILQRFVVRLDFDRSIMTLTRPEGFDYRGPGAVVPFHFQDNQPEVRGSIDGIAGLFAIDTGDNSSLLLIAPFARHYDLVKRYQADIPYDGKAISTTRGVWARRRVGTVAFDGPDGRPKVQVHDPITRISLQQSGFDADRNVSANIGLGILRQFNLTFDYARQRIIFEPNHFYGEREVFNRTGLRLKREGSSWSVTTVYPYGPAAEAGVRVNDIIDRIDGKSADAIDEESLARTLRGAAGTKVKLLLRSPGGARSIDLTLRDVL